MSSKSSKSSKCGLPYWLLSRFPPLHYAAVFSTPAFSTPALWCRVFHSRVFHPCIMVPRFPLPRFPPPVFLTLPRFPLLRFQSPRIFAMCSAAAEHLWHVANANVSVSYGRTTVAVISHKNMLHYTLRYTLIAHLITTSVLRQ